MVIAARQAGLLIDGGGHKMAAGLTVARERLDELGEDWHVTRGDEGYVLPALPE